MIAPLLPFDFLNSSKDPEFPLPFFQWEEVLQKAWQVFIIIPFLPVQILYGKKN